MTDSFLPYGRQTVDDDDVAAVAEVLRADFLTTGPKVRAFEEAFATKVGARYAASCSSGTAALHLAALAQGLGPGDAVIVPSVTFLATANAARYVGAEVVFADVDPETGLMGAGELRAALVRSEVAGFSAKAVFPVHLAGQCVDMEEISCLAGEYGLSVVEDACHALGGAYVDGGGDTFSIGACRHSAMSVFSFHPVKTIAMGEGGAVTTNDEEIDRRLRRFRNHGIVREPAKFCSKKLAYGSNGRANPWYYEMSEIGFNYRASDIHCALGLSQLRKLEAFVEKRRRLAALYDEHLAPLFPLVRPLGKAKRAHPAWHLYVVRIDFAKTGISRDRLMERLRERGIGTQVHYIPVYLQPYYRRRYGEQHLAGAEEFYRDTLSLPFFPAMNQIDVERVIHELTDILG